MNNTLLEHLNDAQQQAVTAPPGHYLVLAGAGSGKTRVLVHRIAWLIQHEGCAPSQLLAVTFTNKAAAEMRARIEQLISVSTRGMWVGTFHGLAHRFLRAHYQEAGLSENFQIIDAEDQLRLIKRIMKDNNIDDARWPAKQIQWFINHHKDEGRRSHQLERFSDPYNRTMIQMYEAYEIACRRSELIDFAELLLKSFEVLKNNTDLLTHYRHRFQHILVDEFQDTNTIQYAWLKLLAGSSAYLMMVGDDDQSIYGWRGAKIEHIFQFHKDYPDAKTIRLEQNYRSTGNILAAANAVISHNPQRLGKELWTQDKPGEPISLYEAINEQDEARFVLERIQQIRNKEAKNYRDFAILYRSNAQSRVLEEAFLFEKIPYRIYGGLRFFDRAEIKDTLAYLRLINHFYDDAAFERIINWPTRGIGDRTIEMIRHQAREKNHSLWQAAQEITASGQLSSRACNAVLNFMRLIETMHDAIEDNYLSQQVDYVIKHSGLIEQYQKEKGEKGQARIENLQELVSASSTFEFDMDETMTPLQAFLTHAALEAGESQAQQQDDAVQLMTLHTAKGLEFPVVFIVGVEEKLFPHQMAINEGDRLNEERRLCYVGMTRAMQKLYLSYAHMRRLYGQEQMNIPSRFIREIPESLLDPIRYSASPAFSASSSISTDSSYLPGQRVKHPKFGEGTVLNLEGKGQHERVQINFAHHGTKWLVVEFAKLDVV